jgi:outer membrane protein
MQPHTNPFMKILVVSLFLAAAITSNAADLKFGVIDMAKAFSEFYKTKEASEKFKVNVEKATQEVNERWSVYKNMLGDIQKLQKQAQDPILTGEERAKRGAELNEKVKEVRALEQEIGEFQNRRQGQLKQEDVQIRKGLYEEILVVVKDKAKADGYDFAFDKSGVSLSTVPVLLYYKDAVDFTDEVVVELNKNAGAAATPATETKK